ncbi:MAG TPA: hypothetical protein ENG49_03770 [Candidatus Omnitrophica bacterium]|nr:hypothetical protein [Candidatus Omnitrophota bacterium]
MYTSNLKRNDFFVVSVNNENQLLVRRPFSKKIEVVPGEFKVERNNLIYEVDKSFSSPYSLPDKIKFRGRWSLDKDHNLVFYISGEEKKNKRLILRTGILFPKRDSLLVQIKCKRSRGISKVYFIKLKGLWHSDKFNRIAFSVVREDFVDTLIFRGSWYLNKNQHIIYEYKKLKTKEKNTLVFKGFWNIISSNRLGYSFRAQDKSNFEFRAHIQTPTLYPTQNKIKYRVGIGWAKSYTERVIILYGTWKIKRSLGLVFEMNYGEGIIKRIKFTAVVKLDRGKKLKFTLKDKRGKPVGLEIIFRRESLSEKDFEYFLRLLKRKEGISIGAGVRTWF